MTVWSRGGPKYGMCPYKRQKNNVKMKAEKQVIYVEAKKCKDHPQPPSHKEREGAFLRSSRGIQIQRIYT